MQLLTEQKKDFGGLSLSLTEGDILTIFSQYGSPVYVKLVRDKDTGKSKGFGFLKYADQRSTVLAVDNLNGTEILGRRLRVDHSEFDLKNDEEQEFDSVCRTVLEVTNSYDGEEVDIKGVLGEGIRRSDKTPKSILSDCKQDKREKEELDPMASYLSSKSR